MPVYQKELAQTIRSIIDHLVGMVAIPAKLQLAPLLKMIYKARQRIQKTTVNRTSKWASLGERVAQLKDGESIVLEPEGDPTGETRKIRNGLNGIAACILVQRIGEGCGGRD